MSTAKANKREDHIGVLEAAKRLGMSRSTVEHKILVGKLPAVKWWGRWLIDPKDLGKVKREKGGYPSQKRAENPAPPAVTSNQKNSGNSP